MLNNGDHIRRYPPGSAHEEISRKNIYLRAFFGNWQFCRIWASQALPFLLAHMKPYMHGNQHCCCALLQARQCSRCLASAPITPPHQACKCDIRMAYSKRSISSLLAIFCPVSFILPHSPLPLRLHSLWFCCDEGMAYLPSFETSPSSPSILPL